MDLTKEWMEGQLLKLELDLAAAERRMAEWKFNMCPDCFQRMEEQEKDKGMGAV